jgi:hypothetical protein
MEEEDFVMSCLGEVLSVAMTDFIEEEICALLDKKGPLTGAEICDSLGQDRFLVWRACRFSRQLSLRTVGTKYLRLDRRVEGYARLSPSILREFLTYTVIGLASDPGSVLTRADAISAHIVEVSRVKSELARSVVSAVSSRMASETDVSEQVCFMIAGDIVYNMAHDVPRPERSTGKLVRGSDMDLVVIVPDGFPENLRKRLDDAIFEEKRRMLMTPHLREEIDYIVKYMARVREQLRMRDFKDLVACKILQEGTLLYGSEEIFQEVKNLLRELGITEKLADMEEKSRVFRDQAEAFLLGPNLQEIRQDESYLFYPVEESEEFE